MGSRVADTKITASSNLQLKQQAQNSLPSQAIGKPANQVQPTSYSSFNVQNAPTGRNNTVGPIMPPSTVDTKMPTTAARPDRISPNEPAQTQSQTFKIKEHCYPAIPPMGEMGKGKKMLKDVVVILI